MSVRRDSSHHVRRTRSVPGKMKRRRILPAALKDPWTCKIMGRKVVSKRERGVLHFVRNSFQSSEDFDLVISFIMLPSSARQQSTSSTLPNKHYTGCLPARAVPIWPCPGHYLSCFCHVPWSLSVPLLLLSRQRLLPQSRPEQPLSLLQQQRPLQRHLQQLLL
jgi:hypothetical protein